MWSRAMADQNHTQEMPNRSMAIPNLPSEIVFEILIRLPIKSVLRFRCVSKPWRSLISDPQFVYFHLTRSLSSKNQRVFLSVYPLLSIDWNQLCVDDHDSKAVTRLDYPWRTPDTMIKVLGSCNGLICLLIDDVRIVVLNPSTRHFKELQQTPEFDGIEPVKALVYGFGCDSTDHSYKVVRFSRFSGDCQNAKLEIFTMREKSWRARRFCHGSTYVCDAGVFLSGSIYWIGLKTIRGVNVILGFDLSDEVLMELPHPSPERRKNFRLVAVHNYLHAVSYLCGDSMDVWMMKDQGAGECWTKIVTVPFDVRPQDIDGDLMPLCLLRNGVALVGTHDGGIHVVIYNFEVKGPGICVLIIPPVLYVESLLSPDCVDGNVDPLQAT